MRNITAVIAAATATAIVVSGSFAIAAIPDTATKVITGCNSKTSGALVTTTSMWCTPMAAQTSALAASPTPAPLGTLNIYDPIGVAAARDMALAPDGTVWIANTSYSSLLRVSPAGAMLATTLPPDFDLSSPLSIEVAASGRVYVGVGGAVLLYEDGVHTASYMIPAASATYSQVYVWDLAATPQGAIWFSSPYERFVGRINTDGTLSYFPTVGNEISQLVSDSDGGVWFAERQPGTGQPRVGHFTANGAFSSTSEPNGGGVLARGPGGVVWYADATSVGRIEGNSLVKESTLPWADVVNLVFDADGVLWMSRRNGGLATLNTSGFLVELTVPAGWTAGAIAPHPDGGIWNLDEPTLGEGRRLARVTVDGTFGVLPERAVHGVASVATTQDGTAWFTSAQPGIGKVDPITDTITYLDNEQLQAPYSITIGKDSSVWFADRRRIGRITPAGQFEFTTVSTGLNSFVYDLAASPDGGIWFVVYNNDFFGQPNNLGHLTNSGQLTFTDGPSKPTVLDVGADGTVWFADAASNSIGRITPVGSISYFALGQARDLVDLKIADDNSVWFGTAAGLAQLNPVTGLTIHSNGYPTVFGGYGPRNLAFGHDGSIWFDTTINNIFGEYRNSAYAIKDKPQVGQVSTLAFSEDGRLWFAANRLGTYQAASIPGTPPPPVIKAADRAAIVSWEAPHDNNSPITQYLVTASPGNATCSWTTGTLSCTIEGLTNGQPYTFLVTASNRVGEGPPSKTSEIVIPGTLPGPPLDVNAVPGNNHATVSWSPPVDDGKSPITVYTVNSNPGAKTCTTAALSCVVTGLTNGTGYTFAVTATNSIGDSPPSTSSATFAPATVPDAPGAPAGVIGDSQVAVSWTAPANNGRPITGYTVTSNPGAKTCTTAALSCVVTGLTNGTGYTFTVTATNSIGTGPASSGSVSYVTFRPFTALSPGRLLETRVGEPTTVDGQFWNLGLQTPGSVTELTVAGRGGVPADASAVVLNVAVTGTQAAGYITVYPCGTTRPLASNLNYTAGQTTSNAVIAKVGANGKVCLYTPAATHLIADVNGYFPG